MVRFQKQRDSIIRQSHTRSKDYGVEPDMLFPKMILQEAELANLLESKKELITVALPFLQSLYTLLSGSGFVVMLTDGKGCVLQILGDEETLRDAAVLNMIPGAFMAEESIGTNAMALAITEDSPIQLTAQEHFINAYHRWTCSAAPVHDANGDILATINLTGKSTLVHPHTLGLVVAAVRSIEHQLRNNKLLDELQASSSFLDAVINNMSFSIITINKDNTIGRVNSTACKSFGVTCRDLVGKPIPLFLPKWSDVWRVVSRFERLLDEEVSLVGFPGEGRYVMNAMPILFPDGELEGVVLTFRDMKRVYSVVNKFTGMNARYTFDDIIGASESIRRIIDFAQHVSDSPSTILITGESGTGKEVFAQAIHNHSSRRDSGFVAVNCGAIPETLIESELFGYEEGAFTGARKGGRPGKFELANGGTLFLDEVGEMPIDMQVRLLRAIQEGMITRVGGSKPIPVDVRIIAATNKDLKEEVEKNRFRLDLYYRLSVIPLRIPPLRERREDIPILIKFFLNSKAIKLRKDVPIIERDVFQMLLRYEWPGNVRELENFIEKTVNLNGEILLDVKDEKEFRLKYLYSDPSATEAESSIAGYRLKSLEEVEKEALIKTIDLCAGNMSKAAKILKISRNTLYQKCKNYGIDR
ncbi:MAG: sigma-54-dependent Fis family transcriptional regulator [Bacteroidales bacterium]|nr:sigma-54-dependent Fis family transcriptional regulator [Bacteroidales bacterium]MBN2749525.1 sigma-54-dependent Fis family transcriptional regulator [Bacteroidales bacterium]